MLNVNVQVAFKDPTLVRRFERVQVGRGHRKVNQSIRELAIERLVQIESSGDPAAIPGTMGELMRTADITRNPQAA